MLRDVHYIIPPQTTNISPEVAHAGYSLAYIGPPGTPALQVKLLVSRKCISPLDRTPPKRTMIFPLYARYSKDLFS